MCYSHLVQGSVLINTLIKEFVEAFYCARCFSKHWWCIVKASIATALFLRMLEEEKNLCLYLKGDYNDHWWDDVEWFHWTNRIDIPVASASQVQEYTGTARLAFCFFQHHYQSKVWGTVMSHLHTYILLRHLWTDLAWRMHSSCRQCASALDASTYVLQRLC